MPTLSLCMIFKDEEAYLEKGVRSVLDLVDECILVDSESTDESPTIVHELQKEFPKKIEYYNRPWPDDFSNQKNFAIERASGDWILFLDADETIERADHSQIKRAIEHSDIDAYRLPIRNYTNQFLELGYTPPQSEKYPFGFIPTQLHRLFRRDERIRYEGILHERVEPSLERLNLKTEDLDVTIHHLGPLKEERFGLKSKRLEFYRRHARRKVEKNPGSAQAHWELGVVLQKQRHLSEAEREFKKAVEISPETPEFEVYYYLSLFQQSKFKELSKKPPKHRKAQFFVELARTYLDSSWIQELDVFHNDYIQAPLLQFEIALRLDREELIEKYRRLSKKLFCHTGLPELLEGISLRLKRDFDKAEALLRAAFELGCEPALQELLIVLSQQEKFQDCLDTFEKLSDEKKASLSPDTWKVLAYAAQSSGSDPSFFLRQVGQGSGSVM